MFNPHTALPSCGVSVSQALATCVGVDPGIPPAPIPLCPSPPFAPPALAALLWLGGRKETARG